jgi:hypothetical protein
LRGVELAPIATFVVATVALYVGLRTIRQRDLADRRQQWWERFRWAMDLTLSGEEHDRELGLEVLIHLSSSSLAGPEELELLETGMTVELARRPDLLDDGWETSDDDGKAPDDEGSGGG